VLLGVTLLVHVQGFPAMPGQPVGPALFPGLVAAGLGICGLILIVSARRARAAGDAAWIALSPWTRSPGRALALACVVGVNLLYIQVVHAVGFIPVAIAYLAVLFAVFGVRMRSILPLAIVMTLIVHFLFYKLLKVPLPWGWLQPIAW